MTDLLVIPAAAILYRLGGGGFWFLPAPFNKGHKWARRYILPALVAWVSGWYIESALLSLILHFNLDEIESRRWDDIACYGFAQAFTVARSGFYLGIVGAWWFCGTWLSNIGITLNKKNYRLDWFFVELIQGAALGAVVAFR